MSEYGVLEEEFIEEPLRNPWDGKPETVVQRLVRIHTEDWAPKIADMMNAAKTWKQVHELYRLHNEEVARLIKENFGSVAETE